MAFNFLILPLVILGSLIFLLEKKRLLAKILTSLVAIVTFAFATFIFNHGFGEKSFDSFSLFYFEDVTYVTFAIFCFALLVGLYFAILNSKTNFKEIGLICIYFAMAVGAVLTGNLISLFIYWEMLAIIATFVILLSSEHNATKVALKYISIHLFGGVLFMIGIIDYINIYNTDEITYPLTLDIKSHYFLLIPILINLGLPPFSSWIVDAYSRCSPIAAIFLSIFTTKVALFTLITLFPSNEVLIYFGIVIAVYGAFFSIFSMKLRELLSLSIIHQMGLGVIAIGALNIVYDKFIISFLVVNVLYKLVFFMIAAILYNRFNHGNLYLLKNSINIKSILGVFLIIAVIQSLGLPFTGGFVAKSYISEIIALSNEHLYWLNTIVFILSSMVAFNVGIKIPYIILDFKNKATPISLENKRKIIPIVLIVIFLQAIFTINMTEFLTWNNIMHSMQILVFSIVLFIIVYSILRNFKADLLSKQISIFKALLLNNTIKLLKAIASINLMPMIAKTSIYAYNAIYNSINVKNYYTSKITLALLIVFLLIYVFLRY